MEPTLNSFGRFELAPAKAAEVLRQQLRWIVAQTAGLLLLAWVGMEPYTMLTLGIATGLGVAATRRAPLHLLPFSLVATIALTLIGGGIGLEPAVAAGIAAGVVAGRPSALGRVEGGLGGFLAGSVSAWALSELPVFGGVTASALMVAMLTAVSVAQVLLLDIVQFRPEVQTPSPAQIQRTLAPVYQPHCLRAWELEQQLRQQAPDRDTREGLAEVATWVYRLGLTLQALDHDISRIELEPVLKRREELLADIAVAQDRFIRERQQGTVDHLDRLLQHRDALALERQRTASLQEYAVAYLEEARAGLALARLLPSERTPERLDTVLGRLRQHAADGDARRQAARELERVGTAS